MWWKITLFIILLMVVCFIVGLYAGGAVYLALTHEDWHDVTFNTLIKAGEFSLTSRQKMFLPWCWCLTAGLTFLPIAMALFAMFGGKDANKSLHGNARFANSRELKVFEYKGNYK